MKKELSLQDYFYIGYFLKIAHISTLKANNILANKNGKTKSAFLRLKKINDDLLQFRCDIENDLYRDFRSDHDNIKLRQRFLGPLDKKLFKSGKNFFFINRTFRILAIHAAGMRTRRIVYRHPAGLKFLKRINRK